MSIFKLSFLKFTKLCLWTLRISHKTFFYAGQLSNYWLDRSPHTILRVLYFCIRCLWFSTGNLIAMFYACSITDLFWGKKLTGGSVSESFCTLQGIVQLILNIEALILRCSRQHKETSRQVPEQMSLSYGNVFFCYQFVCIVQEGWRRSTS